MRSFLTLTCSLIFLLGCESGGPRRSKRDIKVSDQRDYLIQINPATREVSLGGKAAFVSLDKATGSSPKLDQVQVVAKAKIEEALTARGFTVVKDRASAYLSVSVGAGLYINDSASVETTQQHILYNEQTDSYVYHRVASDGVNPLVALVVRASSQSYGKRPVDVIKMTLTAATSESLVAATQRELPQVLDAIEKTPIKPSAKKEKGLPGCLPRFGYELAPKFQDGKWIYVVADVPAMSAAAKAGMKVNDQILAVDSVPYGEFDQNGSADMIYNDSIEVPVKVLREGKEVRLKIKSQISCE